MKRKYSKPEIIFENFSLNTNIAGDCETITELATVGICGIKYDDLEGFEEEIVYLTSVSGCTLHEDDGDYNNVCYHNPTEYRNLFNS